jgi:asparagine synthase (glutamine-hydrolysing)
MGPPSLAPGLGKGLRRLGATFGLARHAPKALGMLEYGGSYAGAYLLRRGLFLPFELSGVLDSDLAREGLRRLKPLARIRRTLSPDPGSPVARVCALESANYLRNQLLRDADWAGMASSVEIRCPLVDHELLRALAPSIGHFNAENGKRALAAAPSRPLPVRHIERAKTGFSVPTDHWLTKSGRTADGRRMSKGLASRAWGLEILAALRTQGAT